MLQFQKFLNTEELTRLHREGELPKGDILGTACRYMAKEGSVLILARDSATWDVEAVFVDIPDADDRLSRNIYSIYSGVDKIDESYFQSYLKDSHFRIAEVHLPSNTQMPGNFSTWRIMRHKKQAIGQLTPFKFMETDKIDHDVALIAKHGETARLEIHLSRAVRKADEDICKRLTEYGFTTRKYIYHVIP